MLFPLFAFLSFSFYHRLPEASDNVNENVLTKIQRTHGVACYVDVHLKRLNNMGEALEFSFETDINDPFDNEGNLASYFGVTGLRVFGQQKKQLASSADKCPGDGCTGMLVGLVDGGSIFDDLYYGQMRQESFGYSDFFKTARGDLPWEYSLNWKKEFGWYHANLAGIQEPASESTCVPKPRGRVTSPNSVYDRTKVSVDYNI